MITEEGNANLETNALKVRKMSIKTVSLEPRKLEKQQTKPKIAERKKY